MLQGKGKNSKKIHQTWGHPFSRTLYKSRLLSQVFALMEEYRIGNLREEDVRANEAAASASVDPFANEPKRHQKLLALSIRPFNAETPFKCE